MRITHDRGGAFVDSFDRLGERIAATHTDPAFEYDLYVTATQRHDSLSDAAKATSSPSGWYELLRFGRNLGPDALPQGAAHWREIPTATGTVWADLSAPGTCKFSDADFPAVMGWNCFDDDTTPTDQRCDSLRLRMLIRDPRQPESIRDPVTLARRLGDPGVRAKLHRVVCRFPSEWAQETIVQRYEGLLTRYFTPAGGDEAGARQWQRFAAHAKAITFAGLPAEFLRADWRFHPREFLGHMRQCGWLSQTELAQCIPRQVIEQTRDRNGKVIYPKSSIVWSAALKRASDFSIELNGTFRKYGISTNKLRISYFLANSIQETIYFSRKSELGGSTTRYAPWYGRGFLQLTWEENYKRYGDFRGWSAQPASSYRDSLEFDTSRAADSAGYYWITCAKELKSAICINLLADCEPVGRSEKLNDVCAGYSYRERTCLEQSEIIDRYPSAESERVARAINTGNPDSKGVVNGLIPRDNVFAGAMKGRFQERSATVELLN